MVEQMKFEAPEQSEARRILEAGLFAGENIEIYVKAARDFIAEVDDGFRGFQRDHARALNGWVKAEGKCAKYQEIIKRMGRWISALAATQQVISAQTEEDLKQIAIMEEKS